jgi:hypothetical protein
MEESSQEGRPCQVTREKSIWVTSPDLASETASTDPEARSRDERLSWCGGAEIMERVRADALEGFS